MKAAFLQGQVGQLIVRPAIGGRLKIIVVLMVDFGLTEES